MLTFFPQPKAMYVFVGKGNSVFKLFQLKHHALLRQINGFSDVTTVSDAVLLKFQYGFNTKS